MCHTSDFLEEPKIIVGIALDLSQQLFVGSVKLKNVIIVYLTISIR
jgi:hypothetical protein